MKKVSFIWLIFFAVGCVMPAAAQDPMVDLPWLPTRDTTGLRTLRVYRVDTLTGERKLAWTKDYDRHGFLADSLDKLTYDAQGRLTEYVRRKTTYVPDNIPRLIESWRCRITYDADGTVQRIENVYPDQDSSQVTYELVSHKVHPKYGLIEYSFRRSGTYEDYIDTVFFRREYDAQGHLLHEEFNSTIGFEYDNVYDIRYYYDASGRRSAYRGYYYECSDSMDYVYDAQGVLTGMKGLFYDLGMEADVVVRCRPGGTRIEAWEYWREYVDDPEGPSGFKLSDDAAVYHMRYDERGALVYQKDPSGIMEYERVYW